MEQFQPALLEIDTTASSKLILAKKSYNLVSPNSAEISHEKFAHYVAIKNYLKKPKPKLTASALEQVSRYLEILHHLCQLQDWKSINSVLCVPVNLDTLAQPLTLPLHEYLEFKGLAKTLLETTQEIIQSFESIVSDLSSIYILKAKALHLAGRFDDARSVLEELYRSPYTLETQVETNAILGIYQIRAGIYKEGLERVRVALDAIEKLLNHQFSLRMLAIKTDILSSLAFHEMNSTRYENALHLYSEALKIIKENNLETKVVNLLAHQGIIFRRICTPPLYTIKLFINHLQNFLLKVFNLPTIPEKFPLSIILQNNYETATRYLIEAKLKAEELKDENAVIFIYHHLSWVLFNQGNFSLAEKYCNMALEEYRKREYQIQLSDCYQQLGRIYLAKGNQYIAIAEQNFEKALSIRKEVGNQGGIPSCLLDLSIIFFHKKSYFKSIILLSNSISFYGKTGTMNFVKFIRTITFFWIWTVGKRDWTL